MQKLESFSEIEDALARLMPTALSDGVQAEISERLGELCGDAQPAGVEDVRFPRWIAASGIAAALVLGFVVFSRSGAEISRKPVAAVEVPGVVILNEADRVERVSDEGLFVDSGGSAVRKVRVRVVEESRIRDEESGIVMTLSEPREEMYLVPVSTF